MFQISKEISTGPARSGGGVNGYERGLLGWA